MSHVQSCIKILFIVARAQRKESGSNPFCLRILFSSTAHVSHEALDAVSVHRASKYDEDFHCLVLLPPLLPVLLPLCSLSAPLHLHRRQNYPHPHSFSTLLPQGSHTPQQHSLQYAAFRSSVCCTVHWVLLLYTHQQGFKAHIMSCLSFVGKAGEF